jgi:hypothetical protein
MIDINKKYRTRDGHEVRIYAVDGVEPYTVHGAIKWEICCQGWKTVNWTADGKYSTDVIDRHLDLVEVKPRIKETVWMNIYKDGCNGGYKRKIYADEAAASNRIACVQVEIDIEEGEGL